MLVPSQSFNILLLILEVLQAKECALIHFFLCFFILRFTFGSLKKFGGVLMSFCFSTMLVMLLCFCWVHFWLCACVSTSVLMDIDQKSGGENEDKRRSCWVELNFFFWKS